MVKPRDAIHACAVENTAGSLPTHAQWKTLRVQSIVDFELILVQKLPEIYQTFFILNKGTLGSRRIYGVVIHKEGEVHLN